MTNKQISYSFNSYKKQLEIYVNGYLQEIISDINNEKEAKRFFEMEYKSDKKNRM